MNFDAKVDELASKPQSHITRKDARDIQSAEVRYPHKHTTPAMNSQSHLPSGGLQGRAFNTPPGPASISAQVRSIADRNEMLGLPAVHDPGPVYVTKAEASEAQSLESRYTGGMVPRGSLAAQMQGCIL